MESSEGPILRRLTEMQINNTSRSYINPLIDTFYIDGPNGRHVCLVSHAAGCNLEDSKESSNKYDWMFPMEVARAIAAQAVLGIENLHSSGVVHGGECA